MSLDDIQSQLEGTLVDADYLRAKHEAGFSYADYLARGTQQQQRDWTAIYERTALSPDQLKLLGGFRRQMNVIVISGIWCGDCVQQGPLLERIAEASDCIDLRWLERDDHPDLARQATVNAGQRVPVVIFCAEDYELAGWYGDRTLSRYRALAQRQLGAACPMPGAPVPQDELDATLTDWLGEFERIQLMLRLSGRLRQRWND